MIIQHNIPALNSYNKLATNNQNLAKNLEKLSSGYRINRAADDAAGLAVSEKMRAQITAMDQSIANAKDGIGLIQTAEGALIEVHSILNRMVELAEQAMNGTYQDATDRAYINEEFKELKTTINKIAENTNFNGVNLFSNAAAPPDISISAGPNNSDSIDVKVYNLKGAATDGLGKLLATASALTDPDEALKVLGYLNGTPEIVNNPPPNTPAVKGAIDMINEQRAVYGAQQNRLDHTINNLTTTAENLTDAEARLRDTDMAKEMMKYTKNSILVQSSQAMLAQANQLPSSVLNLLY